MSTETKSVENVEKKPRRASRTVTFSRSLGGKNCVEHGGRQYDMDELRKRAADCIKAGAAAEGGKAGIKICEISLYIQPENGVCYYNAPVEGSDAISGSMRLDI